MTSEEIAAAALHAAVVHHSKQIGAHPPEVKMTAACFEAWIIDSTKRQQAHRG